MTHHCTWNSHKMYRIPNWMKKDLQLCIPNIFHLPWASQASTNLNLYIYRTWPVAIHLVRVSSAWPFHVSIISPLLYSACKPGQYSHQGTHTDIDQKNLATFIFSKSLRQKSYFLDKDLCHLSRVQLLGPLFELAACPPLGTMDQSGLGNWFHRL